MRPRYLVACFLVSFSFLAAGCGSGETGSSGASAGASGASASAGSGGSGAAGGSGATGGSATGGSATGGSGGSGGTGGSAVIGGDRPVKMYIPDAYDAKKPAPLVFLLHGFTASGTVQEIYWQLKGPANERGFIYAVPDGTFGADGKRFWNATDACCDFGGTGVDDSGYLAGVIDEIKAAYNIDPKRVYFVGHSNGAYMSYRMACDHADKVAAIVGLAGATFADDSKCKASEPVAVAHIHGTMDETVAYDGLTAMGQLVYPGAVASVELWAGHDGCEKTAVDGGTLDLEPDLAGAETKVTVYNKGCKPGGHVELWTTEGGSHVPALTPDFRKSLFDFLEAHPKP